MKCNQFRPGFELVSLCPLSATITITPPLQFFQFPSKGRGTYPSFYFLSILFCGQPGQLTILFCGQPGQFTILQVLFICCSLLYGLVRRTRHAGHCWRSRDELISDVLLWTPTYGRAKARSPARTYIQQLCEDTGCSSEDLPEAMNDREKWRERVRDIRATGTTWWWWWWWYGLAF